MVKCPICYAEYDDSSGFCPDCGSRKPMTRYAKHKKAIIASLCGFIVVVALIVGILFLVMFNQSGPTTVVKKYLKLCIQGDETTATKIYWDSAKSEYAESLINVRSYQILSESKPDSIGGVDVTARVQSSTQGGFPINKTWDFHLGKSVPAGYVIQSIKEH